jgi:protein-tyrosine-phosphatase
MTAPQILFFSRGNASRGQMAEAFLRSLARGQMNASCTGTESSSVNPLVHEVMREIGVDLAVEERPELKSLFKETFRYVVALCDEGREHCPVFPFTPNLIRWSVADPETAQGDLELRRRAFRRARDEIRIKVQDLIEEIKRPEEAFAASHK